LRKTIPILFVLFAAAFLLGATTAPTTSAQKKKKSAPQSNVKTANKTAGKTTSKTTSSKTPSKTPSKTASRTPARKASSKNTTMVAKRGVVRKPAVPSWRTTQHVPTPDRYKEIQEALASKGYLEPSSPNGSWDTSSVSALKKFQEDQNLEPSGKIDSLSLIALGLGPKHEPQPSPAAESRQ
jgi:hypothetical protein